MAFPNSVTRIWKAVVVQNPRRSRSECSAIPCVPRPPTSAPPPSLQPAIRKRGWDCHPVVVTNSEDIAHVAAFLRPFRSLRRQQTYPTNPARPIRRECIFYAFELISEPRVDSIHLMNHFVWTRRQQRTKSALTRACGAVKVIFHVFQAMTRNLHLSTMKVLVHTCFF